MVFSSVLTGGSSLNPPSPTPISRTRRGLKHPIAARVTVPCGCGVIKQQTLNVSVSQFLRASNSNFCTHFGPLFDGLQLNTEALICRATHHTSRLRSKKSEDADNYEAANNIVDGQEREPTDMGISFLLILAIALGIAGVFTITSVNLNQPSTGSFFGVQCLVEGSASSVMGTPPVGFSFKAFGYRIILPEYAPGWIYFWLLMAAGFGLFISEEALNVWVGITLSRMLTLDGTWQSLVASFSRNASYILSTVLWVYCGVCISDMIPFYLGRLFSQSGASDDVCAKLGIGEERVLSITRAVQKYGNLSGFVERFSLGVRNPTAFLAGTLGISPECFFAGVCCGGLITLPLQLGIGFLLRERPVFALATVATVVGIWTVFPYVTAALTALFFYLRRRYST